MVLTLPDRAITTAPLPLVSHSEAQVLGTPVHTRAYLRLRRGTYVERAAFRALSPWQRYAVRVHAFARRHPDVPLCRESAAIVWGLPHFGEPAHIHVHDPDRATSRRFGDVFVHTSQDDRQTLRINGVLVTSLVDTVVDLTRTMPPAQALAVVDASISPFQHGRLDVATLRERAKEQRNRRGRARQQWLWTRADARAESPAESISRAVIEWCGFPTPELQHEFRYGNAHDRVDFYFDASLTIGESDGWQKYGLGDPAEAAKRLAAEKRREDRLRREGHPFARWDLADALRVEPLAKALQAASVPLIRAPQTAFLATLSPRAPHQR